MLRHLPGRQPHPLTWLPRQRGRRRQSRPARQLRRLPLSIGDDLKAASSDALKKASSLLGLALDLYRSDDERPNQNGNGHAEGNGRIKADPMTAFWLAVKERELGREEGKALLERAGGDPARALALLDS